jgi:protein-S-isoprenylcysteine O-methyltransferase Ste14
MFVRALVAFLALPGVVAGLVPLLIVGVHAHFGKTAPFGIALLSIGLLLLLWCVRDFYVSGKGTLAPWDPPKRLVVVGLYRHVRNPMYLAVLTIIAGWSLLYTSAWVAIYMICVAIVFHLRVIMYEEPRLHQQFGAEWDVYRASVSRWLPRLRPSVSG